MRVSLPNGWTPRIYQRPLWDYLEKGGKRAIEIAHRRWGKDDLVLHRTAIAAHERVAGYWHCLPEYEQARKAIWTAVNPHTGKRRIDEAFPPEIRETKDEQQMFIRFKNGSTWQVIGSDRYNSLVGAGIAGVTFSEWALANPSSWGFIRPMIEENGGWATFITTPRGRNHALSLYELGQRNKDWFAELSTIRDTGALSAEQIHETIEEYKAIYGEDIGLAQFEQEYLCSFNAAILGAFYAREMLALRSDGRIRDFEPIEGKAVHTAWDIGVRDDTSIWWFQVIGTVPHIIDCYTASGVGVDHYAEICHSKPWKRGVDFVPHDAKVREWGTGRTRFETMVAHKLNPFVVPDATKMDGIQAARTTLKQAVFHPRTEEKGVAALEQYRREWDDEKKTFRASEVRDWTTHLADAFRYLSLAWRIVPVITVQEKPRPLPGQVVLDGPPESPKGIKIRI